MTTPSLYRSTICRLQSLGALTQGDRRAGSDSTLRSFSFDEKYAETAVAAVLVRCNFGKEVKQDYLHLT